MVVSSRWHRRMPMYSLWQNAWLESTSGRTPTRWDLRHGVSGYDDYLLCTPPKIKVKKLPPATQGIFDGATIWVCDYKTMRTLGTEHLIGTNFGATILHEAQHALDFLRNVTTGTPSIVLGLPRD